MPSVRAFAWHDKTHMAIAKAAGYGMWFNAAAPDLAKVKAGSVEGNNHYFNNPEGQEITPSLVLNQVERYDDAGDYEGHLLGAIIGSLRKYMELKSKGKFADYHMAYASHYLGDLSMPLHLMPYDAFNKKHHHTNDAVIDHEALEKTDRIAKYMYVIDLGDNLQEFESNVSREVARIAVLTTKLGETLKRENRDMTIDEAYMQCAHSASLLRAILK